MKLTKPQVIAIVTPFLTLAAGYLGYSPIQELRTPAPAPINIEVTTPDTAHSHPKHSHKDWQDAIDRSYQRAMDAHKEGFH